MDFNTSKNIGFRYHETDFRFVAYYKEGSWDKGSLTSDSMLHIHEGSTAVHYAQQCFEGMKAYKTKDGRVLLFRPTENYKRIKKTAERLLMPAPSEELFFRAIEETIKANLKWIPPYESNASLYIRPLLIGIGENLGLKPAPECMFRVFVSPVGPYFSDGKIQPITLFITNYDRSAPKGIGAYKAGANYIAGYLATKEAKENGATEALYLDPIHNKYIDEAGSANIVLYMKDKSFITPLSDNILRSITRISLMELAEKELGLTTMERKIDFLQEVAHVEEAGACGTAAIISPIGKIIYNKKEYLFYDQGKSVGPIMSKLHSLLVDIQKGNKEDTYNWTYKII